MAGSNTILRNIKDFTTCPQKSSNTNLSNILGVTMCSNSMIIENNNITDDFLIDILKKVGKKNIESITLSHFRYYNKKVLLSGEFIKYLPPTLKEFHISLTSNTISNKNLQYLPKKLKSFSLKCDSTKSGRSVGLKNLPLNLEQLTLVGCLITKHDFQLLPKKLKYLTLCQIHKPSKLNIFLNDHDYPSMDKFLIDLPRKLVFLNLDLDYNNITDICIKDLPRSLETLILKYNKNMTNACFTKLPPNLIKLHLPLNEHITKKL